VNGILQHLHKPRVVSGAGSPKGAHYWNRLINSAAKFRSLLRINRGSANRFQKMSRPKVYFDVTAGGTAVGRIVMEVSYNVITWSCLMSV